MGSIGAECLVPEMNSRDLEKAIDFGRGEGTPALFINGLPVVDVLPDTPQEFSDDATVQGSDCLLLGAIDLVGAHPIGYLYENFGRLMRNVAPSARSRKTASSHGANVRLGWHTDNPWPFEGKPTDRSPAPRFLCFSGLRIDDGFGNPVPTEILAVSDLLAQARPGLVRRLENAEYRINPPASNDCSPLQPASLLEYDINGQAMLRFNDGDGQIEGLTPRAASAIEELR